MDNIENKLFGFIEEWQQYTKKLERFCSAYELILSKKKEIFGTDFLNEVEVFCGVTTEAMFSSAYQLRKKIFLIKEENLYVGNVYSWNEFKINNPIVEKIGYLTPFSFVVHWHSIPHLINLYSEGGLRIATFIGCDFIENLIFQYPKLESFSSYT